VAYISCNPKKVNVAVSETEYLGYRISGDSVRMTKKHIEVINKITAPKNVKGLQRLLGMFVYWKKLIPFFSKHTYNMRQLLWKDVRFNWSRECQAELDYLNKCLVSDPVLKPLDPNENLIISVDGSSHGLGFCVLQADDDNQLHAVKYGSFATTPQQANYSADDLEAVALMYALKLVESLALVRHSTIITDNSHVLHIHDWTPLNNRQRRMISYISQFNLTVLFIKGSRNLLADALSRMYQDCSIQESAEHEARYVHEVDDFILPVTTPAAHRAALKCEEAMRSARTAPGGN